MYRPKPELLPMAILFSGLACGSSDSTAPSPVLALGKIVFVASPVNGVAASNIYAVFPDGTGLRPLTHTPANYGRPAPSPDGETLVFFRSPQPGDSGDLIAVDVRGQHPVQLTSSPDVENAPAWRPDGGLIAFVKQGDIYTIAPDGSAETRLTFDGDPKTDLAWSPSGNFIAYSTDTGLNSLYDIHRIDANGSNDTTLVAMAGNDLGAAWSPSDPYLAFVNDGGASPHLYRLTLSDGQVTPLTSGSSGDHSPSWSPTGDTLAFLRFTSPVPNLSQEIYLLIGAGGPVVPVTHLGPTKGAVDPVWIGHP